MVVRAGSLVARLKSGEKEECTQINADVKSGAEVWKTSLPLKLGLIMARPVGLRRPGPARSDAKLVVDTPALPLALPRGRGRITGNRSSPGESEGLALARPMFSPPPV